MRFKRGIFLTPPLLGYDQDEDGNLIINEEEAKTVRLAFFMYLYGYSSQQIADTCADLKWRVRSFSARRINRLLHLQASISGSVHLQKFPKQKYVGLLVHPGKLLLVVRPCTKDTRNAIRWIAPGNQPSTIWCMAYITTLFSMQRF